MDIKFVICQTELLETQICVYLSEKTAQNSILFIKFIFSTKQKKTLYLSLENIYDAQQQLLLLRSNFNITITEKAQKLKVKKKQQQQKHEFV